MKAIIISCFNWYKARLEPVRDFLTARGYTVEVLIADFDHIKHAPVDVRYPECTYLHVPSYQSNLSAARIRSHLSFGKQVGEILKEQKPDLVYCQIPPNNAGKICRKYKEKHLDIKLILDIIDLWPESMPLGKLKSSFPAKIWRNWRDTAIKAADYVFTECDLYQEKLSGILNPGKTSTLYLFKEQSEEERKLVSEIAEKRIGEERTTVKFAYLGSMNNIIDIDGICGVIRQFQKNGNQCELRAIGDGESRQAFETAVKSTGCKTEFYGSVFDETEKIKILTPCDYAFNMMKGDLSVGLTIKSIDYLSYGLPLINNIAGDTWKMVSDYGIGINVSEGNIVVDSIHPEKVRMFFEKMFSKESFTAALEKAF